MIRTALVILILILSTPAQAQESVWSRLGVGAMHAGADGLERAGALLADLHLRARADREILAAAEWLSRRGSHPGERVEMAAAVAEAWVASGREDEARRVLARVSREMDRIPTTATKNRALYELGRAWARTGATGEVEAIAAALSRPDTILAELGAIQGEAGDLDAARALAARVTDPSARGKILGRSARARTNAGDLDTALTLLEEIDDLQWRTSVIQAVAVAKAEAGDCAGGRTVADRLCGVPGIDPKTIDLSGGLARRSPHPLVMAKVAAACARGGDPDEALRIVATLPPSRRQVEAIAGIAAAVKDDVSARELLEDARVRAGEIPRPGTRALALVAVATAWTARGETDKAIAILDTAWDAGRKVKKPGLGDGRFTILADLAAAGRCEDASRRARTITAPFWRDGALAAAARGCAAAGETDAALALAAATRTPLWTANAYQETALARLEAGDIAAALDAAARVPSKRGRIKALAAVGAAHRKAGGALSEDLSAALARLLVEKN